ncbi:DUF192 domain-containing protein [Ferruginivarius sediminum]|uniref:DUF192 domain-containing protein n=1 Tax=Ferruginivarius sediminum TaxID=2661937 RepID=A0A369TET9_9PROT|nr:DUF192 domain-containing protein [Ferruginivarius sediminum]RDD63881.1 DUF192 domain-containing protein [Ferruginivarius sediminum]
MAFKLVLGTALLVLMAVAAPFSGAAQIMQKFETDSLTIVTADGARHGFTVELATTPRQRAQGLMYRRDLAADRGMLFVYRRPRDVSMWMKNTFIPLDMLFIDEDGRVVRIAERTVPESLQTISSGKPVLAVLELRGGSADRLGLSDGDEVRHRVFENAE